MQHPDEGTIHAWLDGALSAEESAQLEAHVAECPQCAAAVAEARGFIAASSRILTKLDDAPVGVIPSAAPVHKRNVTAWRAAAAVLVVAVGSFVVVKNRGGDRQDVSVRDSAMVTTTAATAGTTAATETAPTAPPAVTRTGSMRALSSAQPSPPAPPEGVPNMKRANSALSPRVAAAPTAAQREAPQSMRKAAEQEQPPQVAAAYGGTAGAAFDAVSEAPLTLVKEEPIAGGVRAVYAVSPTDTVTLTEQAIGGPANLATTAALSPLASVAQRSAKQVVPSAPGNQQTTDNVLTWVDATTRKQYTLMGKLPKAQLEDVRRRIERERAAQRKKLP